MPEKTRKSPYTRLKEAGKTSIMIYVDAETLDKIDRARQTRYGELTRTTIVHTAIKEFFEKENL